MEWVHGSDPESFIQEVDSIDKHIEYMSGFGQVLVTVISLIGPF
jgi:hypothetical protein